MSSINFDNPWLLLIALPIAVLLLLPFFLTVRKDNRSFHNVTSCLLHLLIAVMVAFSAAGTSIQSIVTETNVYVVADLSHSTQKNLETIDGHIQRLEKNLPLNTELGVVCFGATNSHVVYTRLGEKLKSVAGAVEQIDDTSTDIVSALQYTGKIFKSGVVKRIVLITDAKQSNESDEGALKRTVDNLRTSNIYVDAIYLDSNLADSQAEVQISGVDYAERVYQGQKATATVFLQSSVQTRTTLNVYRNGQLLSAEPIELGVGMKSVPLSLSTDQTGEFEYLVRLSDTQYDGSNYNDVQSFTQVVSSQPKTLFITDSREDEALLKEMYGENYAEAIDLQYASSRDIPYTVAGLCAYDEIVLSNVDVTKIKNYEMFVESLDTVVSLLGKSLIGMGNLGLQNTTDEALLKLADMLPVRYGSPIRQQKLYAIVLDISHTMALSSRFALAKSAAKQLIDLLEDEDKVAVIGFYGEAQIIQPVTSASERLSIKKKIDEVEDDHGTVISGGINGAKALIEEYAKEMPTQIFIISDGIAPDEDDWRTANSVVAELNTKYGVITSALGIVPQSSTKISNLAKQSGKGDYFTVTDTESLNDVALAEISSELGDAVIDRNVYVEKETLYDDVLKNIDDVSYIRGYVTSREKANATTVLTAQHQRYNTATVTVPIYSYWEYGNGRTASFLSTFSGKWTEKWQEKGIDKQFFKNVLSTNAPSECVDVPFVSTLTRQAGGASLEIRPAELKMDATVSVALVATDGARTEISNLVLDSNVYRCAFALPSVGAYKAEITYTYKGESFTTVRSIHVSYLAEYDCFTIFDASPLYQALGGTGTVSEDGNLTIVNDESEIGIRIVNLRLPLLIACVVLFALDIIVRKLKWADIRGIFRKINKGDKV